MCRSTSSTKRCRAACARRGERAQRAQHEELVLHAHHGGQAQHVQNTAPHSLPM